MILLACPVILGGMGQERDDYDDGDRSPVWLRPGWRLGVILGICLFVPILMALIAIRTGR